MTYDIDDDLYVPIWEKRNLTIEEGESFYGIGRDKLLELTADSRCPFVLWVGNRRLIKRKQFEAHIGRIRSL